MLDDENRSLHSQLETLRDQMNTSEGKFLSDLNESKQSLYSERMEHKETKMHLDACRQQLEESKSQSSLELTKVTRGFPVNFVLNLKFSINRFRVRRML